MEKKSLGKFAALALAMGAMYQPMVGGGYKEDISNNKRQDNPHNYPKYKYFGNNKEYIIYAVNQEAADAKWRRINRRFS